MKHCNPCHTTGYCNDNQTSSPAAIVKDCIKDINFMQRLLMDRGERTDNVSVLCAYGLRAEVGVFGSEVRYFDHTKMKCKSCKIVQQVTISLTAGHSSYKYLLLTNRPSPIDVLRHPQVRSFISFTPFSSEPSFQISSV